MFGRGTWAIFGLAKDSLEPFKTKLEDRALMAACSQMAAAAITRQFSCDTLGLNPFRSPRMDEPQTVALEHQDELARYATADDEARANLALSAEILDCEEYGRGVEQFRIHPTMPWYGLWAVSNEWKDVSDLASLKEHQSYVLLERPYKFLAATDRKLVDEATLGATASMRKQVPVLLDFNDGRVYIESGNKKVIYAITERLRQIGAEIVPVGWSYGVANWHSEILNKLYEGTQYSGDFLKRADEASRFKPKDIEKLDDRELESIVSQYFSMTQLPSELWVGISNPAQVRLHDTSPAIGVKAATSATTLLHTTDTAAIISGAVTIQERISSVGKDGGERTFRRDILRMDLNDKLNMTEVGAAMLRGFDMPMLRKDMLHEIRKTKQVPPIEQFWGNWLHELSNALRTIESAFREVLDIDGDQQVGIVPMQFPAREQAVEAAA